MRRIMKNTMDFKEGEIVSVRAIGNTDLNVITDLPFKQEGYDSIILTRCGKNILDLHNKISDTNGIKVIENIDGTFTFDGVPSLNYKNFLWLKNFPKANFLYTISQTSYEKSYQEGISLNVNANREDGKTDGFSAVTSSKTFSLTNYKSWSTEVYNRQKEQTPLYLNYVRGYQMEVGAKATPYEKYKGNKYSIAFPQKIYKGSYNWTTGELDGFSDVELKTPYKVKLNPQKINSFSGTNNIWSSEGNTKVSYYSLDDKVIICAIISNGILKIPTDKRYVVLGTNNFIEFQFDFVENQDMKNVIIEFEKDGVKNEGVLDKDNRIKLPQGITDGDLFIRIKDKVTSKYLSKNKLKVIIDKNIYKIV